MSDLISRQAAIAALNEYFARIEKLKRRGLTKGEKAISLDTVGAIKTLPPANCSEFPNNSDTISRQAAIDALCNDYCGGHQDCKYYPNCENLRSVQKLSSAQPAEPKRGKWIDRGERGDWEWQADGRGKHWHEWECNICHHYFAERSFFCPHCGSDMRKVTT